MALEDRCSPQSAPSPPGIPHSPQSCSSSPFILDMSTHHHQQQHHQQYHHQHHQQHYSSSVYDDSQQEKHYHQSTEISQFAHKMPLVVKNFDDRLTTAAAETVAAVNFNEPRIKVETETDSIMDDADDDDDHEQQIPVHHINQSAVVPSAAISFSITNILSDNFGGSTKQNESVHHENHQQNANDKKTIFRPFEMTPSSDQVQATKRSAFKRLAPIIPSATVLPSSPPSAPAHHHHHQLHHDLFDYNRNHQQMNQRAAAAAAAAVMMAERANFLNCFNPAAYPRIHEEILNSTRKYHRSTTATIAAVATASSAPSVHHDQKPALPPLGSLCKTVSQIGQNQQPSPVATPTNCMSSPPPASISSMSSSISSNNSAASPNCRIPSNSSPQPIPPPQSISRDSGMESSDDTRSESGSTKDENGKLWPAWVYCTRYSDRPSSGPRYRRPKQPKDPKAPVPDEKRPRTAFSSDQLARLKREFNENRYLTERRRQSLSSELGLNEAQIKIWFQNKRAKLKKTSGSKNPLALQLMAQGLYNHTTVPLTQEEEELEMRMNGQIP